MKTSFNTFRSFLKEAQDPNYYQDTFYFTMLISMHKERGGSRDETKNDIRALPEILTVTLVEPEKGGVQRDIGTKYLSTLKLHVRKPKDVNKKDLMRRLVLRINNLRGVSVLRYKEQKPKTRRKAFHGTYDINEREYFQGDAHKKALQKAEKELTQTGPNSAGPYKDVKDEASWESAPPGAPGGLEEAALEEAMKTAADLPEDMVVVVNRSPNQSMADMRVYYALKDTPHEPLTAGDLDRMEAGIDIYGELRIQMGRDFPYEGRYIVTNARAQDGYGPLLYDVALETVGKNGLKPDTNNVSDDASAVWKKYDEREDVESKMLVMDEDQYATVMPEDRAKTPEKNEHLAKVYFKPTRGTTDDLATSEKLVQINVSKKPSPKPKASNKDLSRFDRLYEEVLITIGDKDDLMAFDVQPELNQQIWDGEMGVRPGVKAAIMDIVDEFLEGLDLEAEIKDVIITGSIANYNWSKFSDIDVHILVDFAEVNDNTKMVKKFFDSVRSNWNKLHMINVKGHEVELYVQEESEPHVSTGVYSLLTDKWLVKPKKVKPELDKETATKKMLDISREIDKLSMIHDRGQHKSAFDLAERIKEKIKRMRRSGLDRSGIYSPENLAFKMLRRSGDIEQLFSIYTQAYDKLYSLDQ
jgi:predicted nucleotidyltransferase